MRIEQALGRNRDLPQLESINLNSQSAAGSGADYEHAIVTLPTLGSPSGASMLGDSNNAMTIRYCILTFEAALTGVATNNVTYNFLQRRAGSFLVNTTSATTITAGQQTVTPANMNNIFVNTQLVFAGGTGATETVTVQSVNLAAGTFTATFVNGHSGAYTITSAPLATVTFAAGTNASAYVPLQYGATANNYVKPGDTITIQRLSNGTGLATPALLATVEWITAGPF